MEKDILSRDETLKALGDISLSTLHRLIERGEIIPLEEKSVLRRRRALRFKRSDVEALLKKDRKPKVA